jgi:predicted transposase YbfD/YdcC
MVTSTPSAELANRPSPRLAIKHYFRSLKDPRRRHCRRHLLGDIIVIAICAVICGANDWKQIATFGQRRLDWLKRFLELPNGIPSHDTFERVFARIAPVTFQACFHAWITAVCDGLGVKHVAIDGKTLRRSGSAALKPLHVVSAWATANQIILGQLAVAEKSNEIPAIPELLELFSVRGAFVTIDAMGCQKEIARAIVTQGGDYVLTVKENQPHLLADIEKCFDDALAKNLAGVRHHLYATEDEDHGRQEKRSYLLIEDPEGIRNQEEWEKLNVIGMCYSERTVGGKTSTETRYFIGSRKANAKTYGKVLRNHWGVENNLHWQLDINFGEDDSRIRHRTAADNFAVLRRIALSLLKQHPAKLSIACKRLAAALDTDFLEEILRGVDKTDNR